MNNYKNLRFFKPPIWKGKDSISLSFKFLFFKKKK